MYKSIKAELVANGFEHVLYGTVFLKDGVHVYLSEYDNKTFSITCQKLVDAQDENSNVVSRSHRQCTYSVFQGHSVIAANIAKIALIEVAKHQLKKMSNLIPTRKDDNWNDGTTTIWFEDVSTNDGEILGVVFEGCNVAVLVDVNGEPVDNPAILGSILEAARVAVVNL